MDGLLVGGYPLLLYCDVLVNCTINCTGAYSRFVESWMGVDWAVGCIYWPSQGVRGVGWDYTGPALAYFSIPRAIYKLPQVTAVNQHDISARNTRHPNRTPTPWTTTRSPTRPQHPRLALRINFRTSATLQPVLARAGGQRQGGSYGGGRFVTRHAVFIKGCNVCEESHQELPPQ